MCSFRAVGTETATLHTYKMLVTGTSTCVWSLLEEDGVNGILSLANKQYVNSKWYAILTSCVNCKVDIYVLFDLCDFFCSRSFSIDVSTVEQRNKNMTSRDGTLLEYVFGCDKIVFSTMYFHRRPRGSVEHQQWLQLDRWLQRARLKHTAENIKPTCTLLQNNMGKVSF